MLQMRPKRTVPPKIPRSNSVLNGPKNADISKIPRSNPEYWRWSYSPHMPRSRSPKMLTSAKNHIVSPEYGSGPTTSFLILLFFSIRASFIVDTECWYCHKRQYFFFLLVIVLFQDCRLPFCEFYF